MTNTEKRIPIFSKKTSLGTWLVSTDRETIAISHVTYGFPYYLTNSMLDDFERVSTKEIYELVRVVAQHRTGLQQWDDSTEIVSDYVRDWKEEYDDRLLMSIVAEYLNLRPDDSMRGMVDYFEHKHSYMIDRMKLKDLLQQLILLGEIDRIPSLAMAPSEMKSLQRLAERFLKTDEA